MAGIKVFNRDGHAIIFNGDDMSLRRFSFEPYEVPPTPLSCKPENPSRLSRREDEGKALHPAETDGGTGTPDPRPFLGRLTLNVSNVCNMACRYCYASGGSYNTGPMMMDRRTALGAVNAMTRKFSGIQLVNFFGGEPTLNQEIIELVCEYFLYLRSRSVIRWTPRFGLTTNGYFMSDLMLKLLEKYDFSITVSLDGPGKIHDRLRVNKKHQGSFDAIDKNIRRIIAMGILPEFECTYTGEHLRNGFDLKRLMDYFHGRFRNRTLHCPMVIAPPGSGLDVPLETAVEIYSDAIGYSIENLERGIPSTISIATRLLHHISDGTPIRHFCPAGVSTLTVNADGNVYACPMLILGEGTCLGNVHGEAQEFGPPDHIDRLVRCVDKWRNPQCRECWAQPLCYGCIGEEIALAGSGIRRSVVKGRSPMCDFRRTLYEKLLVSASEAKLAQCASLTSEQKQTPSS
ncbi:MAG: radical SAM protein [Desulfobacteraceae bacterium]|nr:radical SAM protein [Desulfobacteraceae bacterium]